MAKKQFEVEILEDGKVCVKTGDLSGEHHHSADEFMKQLQELMGGEVERKSLKGHTHTHKHAQGEQHQHGGGK